MEQHPLDAAWAHQRTLDVRLSRVPRRASAVEEGGRIRFRCHTGHAYLLTVWCPESARRLKNRWNAIRALEEAEMLMRSMAERVRIHDAVPADALIAHANEAKTQGEALHKLVMAHLP